MDRDTLHKMVNEAEAAVAQQCASPIMLEGANIALSCLEPVLTQLTRVIEGHKREIEATKRRLGEIEVEQLLAELGCPYCGHEA